jgi:flagellar biosynthesis repressor protein FlbT
MALKIELKPHERVIVGSCVITNSDRRARLLIEGDNVPVLREKDILTSEMADTPGKLVYLAVQQMYLSPDLRNNDGVYFKLVHEIFKLVHEMTSANPGACPIIEGINNCILTGDLYRALKETRKLIAYENNLRDVHEASQGKHAVETAA